MSHVIPKILHFVYHPDKISQVERDFVEKARALHPDWQVMEWKEPYEPADFSLSHLWKYCTSGAQLADLVRVDVVSTHGGIYLDVDFEALRPFDSLLNFQFVVGTEDGRVLTNAFFGSTPGGAAIETLRLELSRLSPEDFEANVAEVTGPAFFARTLQFRADVTVLPREVLYPYNWNEAPQERFRPTTLAVHRWHGSWVDKTALRKTKGAGAGRRLLRRVARRARRLLHGPTGGGGDFAAYGAAGPMVVRTIHGHYLHADGGDLSITPHLATKGYYELPEERFLARWLKGGDWLVDVGANIGVMSMLGAARVGPMGRVVAFEPNPTIRAHLEKGVALNWFQDRVKILPCAAGEDPGVLPLTFSSSFLGGGSLVADRGSAEHDFISAVGPSQTVEVKVVRLDDVLPAPFCVRLLKIDVEGFEAFVLRGARELLASGRVDAVLLEASPSIAGDQWPALLAELRGLLEMNFGFYLVGGDGAPRAASLSSSVFDRGRNCLFVHATAPGLESLQSGKNAHVRHDAT